MKRIVLGVAATLLFLSWQGATGHAAAPANNCLVCHTNDKMMQILYKPPALESGEAEG